MSKTILLVDDQDLMLRVLQATLRGIAAAIHAVKSGPEAVQFVRNTATPDAIIMDYSMPEQDGVETLRQIRSLPAGAAIPVIMLTARDQTLIRQAAGGLHVHAFMTKPFSPNTLVQTVREMLATPPPRP